MKRKEVVLQTLSLRSRLNAAFKKYKVTPKGRYQFRLCVMIRMQWGHTDTYERNIDTDNFNLSEMQKLCQILGVTIVQLLDNNHALDCTMWNLSIPEYVTAIEMQK